MEENGEIQISSMEGNIYNISKKAAMRSGILKGMIEDFPDDVSFPLKSIKGNILEKIKEYLMHYKDEEPQKIEIPLKSNNFNECVNNWDFNFLGNDIDIIFDLLEAANYMDIKPLHELVSAFLGSNIRGINSNNIFKDFEIEELTEKEKEQMMNDKKYLEENL
jgi:S-phase kinase-associated protein 1